MRLFISLLVIFLLFTGCNTQKKESPADNVEDNTLSAQKAVIRKKVFYETLPSASGVEQVDNLFYVLSDDSPFLYVLNKQYQLTDTIRLFDTEYFINGRIPTEVKYDPEALAFFNIDGDKNLLAVGSGAKVLRERVFLINLQKTLQKQTSVKYLSFRNLYNNLKNDAEVGVKEQLNLEGMAVDEQFVYLLPRTLKTNGMVLVYKLDDWVNYISDSTITPVYQRIIQVHLPEINGVKAGLSGATVYDDNLFFTASVENTQNATLDGEVMGSFVGKIKLSALHKNTGKVTEPDVLQIIEAEGNPYIGKAESLTILEKTGKKHYWAIVVSDDDKGHSELLEVELQF